MSDHRCWGCGNEETMGGCGTLCPDCSWEENLAAQAYTGEFDDGPREGTPECCVRSYEAERAELWSS